MPREHRGGGKIKSRERDVDVGGKEDTTQLLSRPVAGPPAAATPAAQGGFQERWWVSWLLALTDFLALQVSLLLALGLRAALGALWPMMLEPAHLYGFITGLALVPLGYYAVGLYPGYGVSPVEHFRRRSVVTSLAFLVLLGWGYSLAPTSWPIALIAICWAFALVLPLAAKASLRVWLNLRGYWGTPVVVIGATPSGRTIVEALQAERKLGLVPLGYYDDRSVQRDHEIDHRLVRSLAESRALASNVRVAILAMPRIGKERLGEIVRALPFPHVVVVPDFFGVQNLWVTSVDLGGVLGLEMRRNLLVRRNRVVKRLLDYALVLPIALVSLPVIAVLALWIAAVSRSTPFYAQIREGQGGKAIRVWKLRTMYRDADERLEQALAEDSALRAEWGRFFKLKDDPRILPGIGQLLRRTSLDELPQLWNVLRGDMSLVGPRPFPVYHLEHFDVEFRALRSSVLPGITGLWQVAARSEGDLSVQENLDSFYIRNWSPWLDLYLLLRTPWAVMATKGAY